MGRRRHFLAQHLISQQNVLPQDAVTANNLDGFKRGSDKLLGGKSTHAKLSGWLSSVLPLDPAASQHKQESSSDWPRVSSSWATQRQLVGRCRRQEATLKPAVLLH